MDKRKLAKVPIETATEDMLKISAGLKEEYMVTASLIDDNKILLLNFYEVSKLKKGKTEAAFRTFLSKEDYITQDLKTSKIKWKTASFENMNGFCLVKGYWNEASSATNKWEYRSNAFICEGGQELIADFFSEYTSSHYHREPWNRIYEFQNHVKEERLEEKRSKVLKPIELKMEPIVEPEQGFKDWVWNQGMSFSRYGIYREIKKGKAEFECTHCKKTGIIDRNKIRLRNNEKGECPFCGSKVTYKAKGKMPYQIVDERWFLYVDRQENGFLLRYFKAWRYVKSDSYIAKDLVKTRIEERMCEYSRNFWTFSANGKYTEDSYEWGVYHQRGKIRWIPDEGNIACMECILYPGNLPQAWEHTPMKYSALEILAQNIPTEALRYEDAMDEYLKFPKLEWICKMGLNQLVKDIAINRNWSHMVGKINYKADTIYEILGLNKVNTRTLQAIDGNHYELRLLQVAQKLGIQMKPEQLKEFYDTFECNTELLEAKNRKVSLHKLCKYIEKESERYPLGERACRWSYSYNRYRERTDPRIERKQNMAHDWLEYLGWCKELKYDTSNMFIYMPNNFKNVHDRVAGEYRALQDKKAAEEKRRRDEAARKELEQTKKAMAEIFEKNNGTDAFSIKGKGLILVVPKSGDEIRAEGEALHHCVGGYVQRVARGETNIFFVRKADEPGKSYFTMEWNHNKVIQCRGKGNCGMPPEVKAFVKVFEQKMQEAVKKDDKQQKRRCG